MKKIIISVSKGIAALTVITGAVWGFFRAYDNIMDNQADQQEMLEHISIEQSFFAEDIEGIKDTLKDITTHQKRQDQHMADMERAAGFYIRNQQEMTEEAMEDALEVILKKNTGPIVSIDTAWTPYVMWSEPNVRNDYVHITGKGTVKSSFNR